MTDYDPHRAGHLLSACVLKQLWHRATLSGVENIPPEGAAMLVSNHGRLDIDSLVLLKLVRDHRGRVARGMADRLLFRLPLLRELVMAIGAVEGNAANARHLLDEGNLLLTYPGGVPEIVCSRYGREDLRWAGRSGFARVAIAAQVPVLPVASLGVNNGFFFVTAGRLAGRLLYQGILRMGPSYGDYRDPLAIGLIPLPLPYSLAMPLALPCKVRYVVGAPLWPETPATGADDPAAVERFAGRVENALRELIVQQGGRCD